LRWTKETEDDVGEPNSRWNPLDNLVEDAAPSTRGLSLLNSTPPIAWRMPDTMLQNTVPVSRLTKRAMRV
jgi:hypothetical protein